MKKNHIIITVLSLISIINCTAQTIIKYNNFIYKGYTLNKTFNTGFINKKLLFVKNRDTIYINQKLPYSTHKLTFYDYGIYFNCHLEIDSLYTFKLKKIRKKDVPSYFNNYYRINTLFKNRSNPSRFIEIKRNTAFLIKGYYDKYFDLNNELFEIMELSPLSGCGIIH